MLSNEFKQNILNDYKKYLKDKNITHSETAKTDYINDFMKYTILLHGDIENYDKTKNELINILKKYKED